MIISIRVDNDTLAFDILRKVGIGGTFLAEDHTLNNFKSEQWNWDLFLRKNYTSWEKEGANDILARANKKVEKILKENYPPEPVLENNIIKTIEEIEDEASRNN